MFIDHLLTGHSHKTLSDRNVQIHPLQFLFILVCFEPLLFALSISGVPNLYVPVNLFSTIFHTLHTTVTHNCDTKLTWKIVYIGPKEVFWHTEMRQKTSHVSYIHIQEAKVKQKFPERNGGAGAPIFTLNIE